MFHWPVYTVLLCCDINVHVPEDNFSLKNTKFRDCEKHFFAFTLNV